MVRRLLKPIGSRALRAPVVHRAAAFAAAIRGRRLVLVFHRLVRDGEPPGAIVPTVSEGTFRRQLETLLELSDLVPLASMLDEVPARARPRVAVTFDDDYESHVEVALPILRELNVAATFFLAGRSLHDLGPFWFETLDALARSRDLAELGRWLGIETDDPGSLVQRCERDPGLQQRIEAAGAATAKPLGSEHIRALADAGMTIGFHTVRHRLLTGMAEREIDAAVSEGRRELEDVIGEPLRFFAYPHGKADGAVAERVRRAGYAAAWTGRPRPIEPGDDPYLLGRWEAGAAEGHDLGARLSAVMNRWIGA
jgi:peptidoglycan/xylan/chitin deacetylase (PgdA/CDA1 family)